MGNNLISTEKTFGQRIRELRHAKGESLSDAAKALGCTPQNISLYENMNGARANPKLKTIRAFAAHYAVKPSFLIGE